MMTSKTVNISLPSDMYHEAKKFVKKQGYTSLSELVCAVLRREIYPRLTENGFTPEFEQQVLDAEKELVKDDVVWNGKGSYTEFMKKHLLYD